MATDSDDRPLTPEQLKALFAEMRADEKAAVERDTKAAFKEVLGGPTEVAPKVAQILRDRGREV